MFSLHDLIHAMGDGARGGHPMFQSRAGFYPGTSHSHLQPRCDENEPFNFNNLFGGQSGSDYPTNCHKLVNEMCPGVAEALGDILQGKCRGSKQQQSTKQRNQEKTTQKKAETPAPENCENNEDKRKDAKTLQQNETHHEPTFHDVINNVLSAIHQSQQTRRQQTEPRWLTKVDCRGFALNDIKVKVDSKARQLLLKAFKKEESQNGVRTSGLRKSVALPEIVDPKQVKCKLSSDGFLLVEAPYVEKRETEREETDPDYSPHGLVGDLMTTLFPGFLGFVEEHNKTKDGDEDKNKSKDDEKTTKDTNNDKPKEKTSRKQEDCRQNIETDADVSEFDNQKCQTKTQNLENNVGKKPTKLELKLDENQTKNEQELSLNSNTTLQVEPELDEDQESTKNTITNEKGEMDPQTQMDAEKTEFLEHSSESHKSPTVSSFCPEKETGEVKVIDVDADDRSSTTSDDSFVLLSQLEQENEETSNHEIADRSCHVDCITPDDLDQNVKGQIIIDASSDLSPLVEPENMADNHQQIPTQDTQNENTTVTTGNHQHANKDDKNDVVLFRLEMPSVNPDSLQVTFDQSTRVVTITATKGHMAGGRPSDTISRSVALDDSVDENGLQCFYRDGTLTVTAPRKPSVRTIPIKL